MAVKKKSSPETIDNKMDNGYSYNSDMIFRGEIVNNPKNEIVLSLTNEDAHDVISIFHEVQEPIQEVQKDEQVWFCLYFDEMCILCLTFHLHDIMK